MSEKPQQIDMTMFKKIFIVFCIAFFVLNPLSEVKAFNARTMQKYDFIGTWKGEGKIIVGWCKQKQLSFELRIDLKGNVSGKIGDAHIRTGKIKINYPAASSGVWVYSLRRLKSKTATAINLIR